MESRAQLRGDTGARRVHSFHGNPRICASRLAQHGSLPDDLRVGERGYAGVHRPRAVTDFPYTLIFPCSGAAVPGAPTYVICSFTRLLNSVPPLPLPDS